MTKKRRYSPSYSYTNGKLSDKFASPPDFESDNVHYSIGFRYYDKKKGNLDGAKPAELKKVLELFDNAGKCQRYQDIMEKITQDIKPVKNLGHYAKYFSGLTDDVDLLEFDAGKHRGFFFFDHPAKLLQMVAIDKHPEYRKQKRK